MKAIIDIFQVVVPVCYAAVAALYGITFFGHAPGLERVKSRFLYAALGIHLIYLGLRTAAFDHLPVTSVFEIMTLLAASISLGYTYIEIRTKTSNTGFFIILLALIFQLVSSIFIRDMTEVAPILRNRLLGFHVSAALLGYTAISLSAVYGLLYLMLYHEIKSTHFGLIYKRLPNLETLEKMSHKAEVFGFVMLSIAIIVGLIWLPRAFETFSYLDPKLIGTMAIWALYAVGLLAKRRLGWQGRKTMLISLVAFGFVFLSMTVINMYLSGFHSFH